MDRGESTLICVDVVEAIADVRGTIPSALPFVLHDYVNTEALETLVTHGSETGALCFEVPGHEVAVRADRTIVVDGEEYTEKWVAKLVSTAASTPNGHPDANDS